jgi:3-methylfumaryl-CoA hydratase
LRAWEGRSETLRDEITAAPVRNLSATLDRDDPLPQAGTELPPLWHWLYFLPSHPQGEIGPDGHAGAAASCRRCRCRGACGPAVASSGMRRCAWARRRSAPRAFASVAHKAGRSGDLVFVTVRHEIAGRDGIALTEEQDIVYRPAAQPGEAAPAPQAAPADAAWSRDVTPDPVLLFRYSALTFNGHRIHYDRTYAMQEEGYPGLVVHGPLIATLLAELAQREQPAARLKRFSFRAVRPTFDLHPFRVCGQPSDDGASAKLWGRDHEGALTMQADIHFE